MNKIKEIFNYRKRWKQQKNRNKRLTKKINKIETSIAEDLKLDITNDEIRKLKKQVNDLKNQVKKLNLEAQKYFEILIEKRDKISYSLLATWFYLYLLTIEQRPQRIFCYLLAKFGDTPFGVCQALKVRHADTFHNA